MRTSAAVSATRYTTAGDGIHLAYEVTGDGPRDVVVTSGFISHLEHQWADPGYARSLERLATFARVICFDKRGLGLSDPVPITDAGDLERRTEDIAAVMAAAGSQRAVYLECYCGPHESGSGYGHPADLGGPRGGAEVPGAAEKMAAVCTGHDHSRPGKPRINWMTLAPARRDQGPLPQLRPSGHNVIDGCGRLRPLSSRQHFRSGG